MGCGMEFLKWLSETERLPRRGRLLDIGEQCLLQAPADDIKYVLNRHGCTLEGEEFEKFVADCEFRSTHYGDVHNPTLFLGDVLTRTEVEYVSLDVVSARYAELFDLNIHSLAPDKRNSFDIVVNFGTTEHLMNQFNSFKVIHEACRPGGYMFHQLPSTGYINHGYFCYNALMFKELAEANGYVLEDLWFYGPNGTGNIVAENTAFPSVTDGTKLRNNVNAFRHAAITNANINVLLRKVTDGEFRVGLEVKTAAGDLDANRVYTSRYIARPQTPVPAEPPAVAGSVPEAKPSLMYRALRKVARKVGIRRRRAA
jgi:hypothetical protein